MTDVRRNCNQEIEREIAGNTILVYGKGTKTRRVAGSRSKRSSFSISFGYPFEVIDVLENMPKREALSEMTNWPTLPKVFINGKFYGDTDILGPMAQNGELQTVSKKRSARRPAEDKPSTCTNDGVHDARRRER